MADGENWSWSKFIKGFFDGRNYGKAIVLGFCMMVILLIGFSTYSFVKSKLVKPVPTVGTNSGTVNNVNKEGNSWSLINLFNWR